MAKKTMKMDAETKKKLLGLVPITSNFTYSFTPDIYNDVPEEYRPVFTVKPWTSKELRKMAEIGADDEKAIQAIAKQIIGWNNVIDITTEEEIPFEADPKGGIKLDLLEMLPAKVSVEILTMISKISGA